MTEQRYYRIADHVGTEIAEDYVVLSMAGQYVQLNPTARRIWDMLEEPKSASEVSAGLREIYDVAEADCSAAVARALEELSEQGLIKAAKD